MAQILIVDDDPIFCGQLSLHLKKLGHEAAACGDLREALERLLDNTYDLVFLDVYLPDAFGLDAIGAFKQSASEPEVIIITSKSDPDSADMAIKNGAWYFLVKPASFHVIKLTVERALEYRQKKIESASRLVLERDVIIGSSPALKQALIELARAAAGASNALVTGETGTGKELFARALHVNSSRKNGPFVVVDCANIPDTLAESLLFGHVKGAFTDAVKAREGMVALADKGTLFLDELGELSESVQRSLLRVLQEKRFRPLGSRVENGSDFRVVAVTNKDLRAMVEAGSFRRDLYYRLAQVHIHIPPLRERVEDVKQLVAHYVPLLCSERGLHAKAASQEFIACLAGYPWPGNVRELVNALASAIENAQAEPVLETHHLPSALRSHMIKLGLPIILTPDDDASPLTLPAFSDQHSGPFPTLKVFRDQLCEAMESQYLDMLLLRAGRSVSTAMKLADISRARLYQLLKKHHRSMNDEQRPPLS